MSVDIKAALDVLSGLGGGGGGISKIDGGGGGGGVSLPRLTNTK
jgi:hypothetical protein